MPNDRIDFFGFGEVGSTLAAEALAELFREGPPADYSAVVAAIREATGGDKPSTT
ncbi:MAG: hypothetical protein QF797_00510 [Alphaproteobacteria bacterium]|jgi:hypothetical protein|nr:hypothetical protein [Alphaproteobacteria bacterium]MDP6624129.1 hypothetical protein [Alphaproteobacteria bacterium]|tara:strand:- start:1942 stop:2106 length:165 start_codon:yes stop_codon:yes gene_type:complete